MQGAVAKEAQRQASMPFPGNTSRAPDGTRKPACRFGFAG